MIKKSFFFILTFCNDKLRKRVWLQKGTASEFIWLSVYCNEKNLAKYLFEVITQWAANLNGFDWELLPICFKATEWLIQRDLTDQKCVTLTRSFPSNVLAWVWDEAEQCMSARKINNIDNILANKKKSLFIVFPATTPKTNYYVVYFGF